MKLLIKLLFVLSLYLIPGPVLSINRPSDPIQISLLTCSSGALLSSSFGHSAIRIQNQRAYTDIVYDFGVFDFNEPNFLYNFIKGNLLYRLDQRSFNDFIQSYKIEERDVIEEQLHLSYAQKIEIIDKLRINYKPEHRKYHYDFLKDNCSTRIRDLFINAPFESTDSILEKSYRQNLKLYLKQKPWFKLGIDLMLGATVDQKMSFIEDMFLPQILSENLKRVKNIKLKQNLIQESEPLISFDRTENAFIKHLHPTLLFYLLFLSFLMLFFKHQKLLAHISICIYIIIGLIGLGLVFMWFGTHHIYTKSNWNILWLNPLYLVLVLKSYLLRKYLIPFLSFLGLSTLIACPVIPQAFNPAIIPLIGILMLMNLNLWLRFNPAKQI